MSIEKRNESKSRRSIEVEKKNNGILLTSLYVQKLINSPDKRKKKRTNEHIIINIKLFVKVSLMSLVINVVKKSHQKRKAASNNNNKQKKKHKDHIK